MQIHWSQVARLAETFAPLILEETPLAPLASYVARGITIVQQATEKGPLTNDEKLQLAIQEVHNGVEATNAQAQREILNQPDIDAMLTASINSVVAAINLKHDTTTALTTPATPPPTTGQGTSNAPPTP